MAVSLARHVHGRFAAVLLLLLTGCASAGTHLARPSPETLPANSPLLIANLADGDAWLRHHVMFGDYTPALAMLEPQGPLSGADRLLRSLQEAMVLRAAGDFERSNELLEWADREAEKRYVRSVSETAGSLIINDRVVSYVPRPGEAVMVPYYRMLNWMALGDVEAAAVEARRISAILDRAGDQSGGCRSEVLLRYVAGLVYEAAAEHNDALVSLRRAEESSELCREAGGFALPSEFGADLLRVAVGLGVEDVAGAARERYATAVHRPDIDTGEVLIVLEHGFVAHLTEQALHLPILERDIEDLESGDLEEVATAVANLAGRLANNFLERSYWGSSWDDHPAVQVGHALNGAYILRVAWPAVQTPGRAAGPHRVMSGNESALFSPVGDLSGALSRELDEARGAALTRMIGRGILKYLATREMEKKAEKQGGELLGFVTGRLANLAGNELERADTRSWTLLPDQISIARLTLPPGNHTLRIERFANTGLASGVLELGTIEVTPGKLVVVTHRLWSDEEFIPTPEETDDAKRYFDDGTPAVDTTPWVPGPLEGLSGMQKGAPY